eukprot:121910-Pyramimonas_sp.AAC.2
MRTGAPEPMPAWGAGGGPQLCSICSGDLGGTVEVLILCGRRFHKHCLEQWSKAGRGCSGKEGTPCSSVARIAETTTEAALQP